MDATASEVQALEVGSDHVPTRVGTISACFSALEKVAREAHGAASSMSREGPGASSGARHDDGEPALETLSNA